jgi:hypothetical protein
MEDAPKVSVPKTDVPFLDPKAIAEPAGEVTPETAFTSSDPAFAPENRPAPCADCAKYARLGYAAGAVVGITAGALVAYVILKNRLAPVDG